jgi:hypothetical protein
LAGPHVEGTNRHLDLGSGFEDRRVRVAVRASDRFDPGVHPPGSERLETRHVGVKVPDVG